MLRPFTKPSLTVQDQIRLLEQRGMTIADRPAAEHALTHISYYRLRAYWYPFEIDPSDPAHKLRGGTSFEEVLALYDFDRRLRLHINEAIERIEMAARGAWAHHLALTHGPHGYLDRNLYPRNPRYQRNLTQLQEEVSRSHDTFIAHYQSTYSSPQLPPVWMVAEVMSFGLLSKWISLLAARADRQAISRALGLNERIFTSFLHHLATVRNVCAHHGRLWNRRLTVTASLPSGPPELAAAMNAGAQRQIYNTLALTTFILQRIAPSSNWRDGLLELLVEHPTSDFAAMGFPHGWQQRALWT
ncbi:MAG: Abi family protein [Sphingomonas sp.]